MVKFKFHMVVQLFMLVTILTGILLIVLKNNTISQKEKKKRQTVGIVLVTIGSVIIISIWSVLLWDMKKQVETPLGLAS